ncbi:hypothetical protein [Flavobacterium kingsejongi]|uniref:Uncharacterized protein n=1 Tax=Flavobacterium kingsejongi TaxID=1678728 RepID=A0A2S1LLY7_9FLAO|nr:hypothetical protein [Flavobacterium kingsejongi]AWG24739.1 hypothetical protein FK004_05605 [Flavobacterium kingsejongi]
MKLVLFLLLVPQLLPSGTLENNTKDYEVLTVILKDKDNIILNPNASTPLYLKTLFEENFKDSLLLKQETNAVWLSEHSGAKRTNDSLLLKEVFSVSNYNYMSSQFKRQTWEVEKMPPHLKNKISITNTSSHYTISKPLYTKNGNYAIVSVKDQGTIALWILTRSHKEWKLLKFIPITIL